MLSSPSALPSAAIVKLSVAVGDPLSKIQEDPVPGKTDKVLPVVLRRSDRLYAVPLLFGSIIMAPEVGGLFNVMVNATMSPSSTWRPGQVVSRSPLRLSLVPQLAGVPAQLPLAEMVTVCAAAGMDVNAASAKMKQVNAKRGLALPCR